MVGFRNWFPAWDWAGILINMRVDNNKIFEAVGPDMETSCTVDNILCLQSAAILQQTLYTAVLPGNIFWILQLY